METHKWEEDSCAWSRCAGGPALSLLDIVIKMCPTEQDGIKGEGGGREGEESGHTIEGIRNNNRPLLVVTYNSQLKAVQHISSSL